MRNKRLGVVAGIVAVGLVVAGIVTMSIGGGFARAETPSHAGLVCQRMATSSTS
jgi:Flp pilus assembly protein CpaB